MAGLRRLTSGGAAPPPQVVAGLARNGLIALGAVGLSIGAAWAWSQRTQQKRQVAEVEIISGSKGHSPRRRRGKRHKARKEAVTADTHAVDSDSSEGGMQPSADPGAGQLQDARASANATKARGVPAAGCREPMTQDDDGVEMPDTFADGETDGEPDERPASPMETVPPPEPSPSPNADARADADADTEAEPAAGEWIAVERRQRRARRQLVVEARAPEALIAAEPAAPADCGAAQLSAADGQADPGNVGSNVAETAGNTPADAKADPSAAEEPAADEAKKLKRRKKVKRPKDPIAVAMAAEQAALELQQTREAQALAEAAQAQQSAAEADAALAAADAAALERALAVSVTDVGAHTCESVSAAAEAGASSGDDNGVSPDGQPAAPVAGGWVQVKQKRRGKRPSGEPRTSNNSE